MRFLQCIFVATLRLRVVMIVTVVGCTVGGEHTLFCYLSFFFLLFNNVQKHVYTRTGSHFVYDNVNASPPLVPIAWSLALASAYLSNVCTTSVHLKLCRYYALLLVFLCTIGNKDHFRQWQKQPKK